MSEQEVPRLVKLARNGDQDAFGELFCMYHERLVAVTRSIVGNHEDGCDLAQQTWVKAWNKLDTFKAQSKFYTWIYRIATLTCIDFLRKRKSRPVSTGREEDAREMEWVASMRAARTDRPDVRAGLSEIRARFDKALQHLSPEHRMALVLREVEGLSYEEIATAMKCRKGTVMSRIFHARRRLQEHMAELS